MTVPASPAPARGTFRVVGRYAIFDEIASGGMASVHLGRLVGDGGFSRVVAVKQLHPQLANDAEFVSMFLDEARLSARVRHPNVVQTLDVLSPENELLLVMDYVHGVSLASLVSVARKAGKPVDPKIATTVVAHALEGLHAAHEACNERGELLGIVHRDVSPENILVDVDGMVRILDFGVAKAINKLVSTRAGQVKGTLAYSPPEQVRGQPVTRRSDVFAAGVVLWEALTGTHLFDGDSPAEIILRVLEHPIARPSTIAAHVPEALDDIVLKALSRDPTRRFPTAREMSAALQSVLPLVSARALSQWVEASAGTVLAARSAIVSRVEQTPLEAASTYAQEVEQREDANDTDPTESAPEPVPRRPPPPPPMSQPQADPMPKPLAMELARPPAFRAEFRSVPPEETLRERIEWPVRVTVAGVLLSLVDWAFRSVTVTLPVRPVWVAEILVVVGVLWALIRIVLPSPGRK